MTEPLFWLGLSILLVAVSLAAVLIAALPALQELARAARSAEKLFDTLNRELPPTLEAIRSTGQEIAHLTEDVGQNMQSAGRVVEQIDQSLTTMKEQAHQAQITTRSMMAGVKAAWQVLSRSPKSSSRLVPPPIEPENPDREALAESDTWEIASLDESKNMSPPTSTEATWPDRESSNTHNLQTDSRIHRPSERLQ